MDSTREQHLNEAYVHLAESLDIPPSKYKEAVDRYRAVGEWLEAGEYLAASGEPEVYPQGSFRLGTVVRPLREGKEADYDIDLVCELKIAKTDVSPSDLKHLIC